MKLFITTILLTVSLSSVAESYAFNDDVISACTEIRKAPPDKGFSKNIELKFF